MNLTFVLSFCLTLFFYSLTLIRITLSKLSKLSEPVPVPTVSAQVGYNHTTSYNGQNALEKQYLAGLMTIAVALGFYGPAAFVLLSINRLMTPDKLVMYPNYILVHFLHHGVIFLWNTYLITVYFSNSKTMRATVWREIQSSIFENR